MLKERINLADELDEGLARASKWRNVFTGPEVTRRETVWIYPEEFFDSEQKAMEDIEHVLSHGSDKCITSDPKIKEYVYGLTLSTAIACDEITLAFPMPIGDAT